MDEMYKDDGSPRISEQELEQIFVSRSDSVPSPPSQDDNTMEIEVSTETARNLAILFGKFPYFYKKKNGFSHNY